MKITPINITEQQQPRPSVAVAVVADEELGTKTFDDVPLDDDDDDGDDEITRTRWCSPWALIVAIIAPIALIIVVTIFATLPMHRETYQDAPLQITIGMNHQSEYNETRVIKEITSNGQNGLCSIDVDGLSITYEPNLGFFGSDTCAYTVTVCNVDFCDDVEETITVVVTDPDAPETEPDAMVLVSEGEIVAAEEDASLRTAPSDGTGAETTTANVAGTTTAIASSSTIVAETSTSPPSTTSSIITTTTTTTTPATTTTTATTSTEEETTVLELESLVGKKWEATAMVWPDSDLTPITPSRNGIFFDFISDTRVSGACGNNRCWGVVTIRGNKIMFDGMGRTRMVASPQEMNYVSIIEGNTFFWEANDESSELYLYEIVTDGDVEERGDLMVTYVQMPEEDDEEGV
jgi:heat shock protein HslJ